MSDVLDEEQCFSLKDLAIHGKDILSLGVPQGKVIGDTLQHILNKVISGELDNHIEPQMQEAQQYIKSYINGRS